MRCLSAANAMVSIKVVESMFNPTPCAVVERARGTEPASAKCPVEAPCQSDKVRLSRARRGVEPLRGWRVRLVRAATQCILDVAQCVPDFISHGFRLVLNVIGATS